MIENYAESFKEIEMNGYERSSITHHGDFLKWKLENHEQKKE